jgi:hypothetical protein
MPHHFTSHHFTYLHTIPTTIPLPVTTLLTLFLSLFSLQGKDASKPAGNWFQLLIFLFIIIIIIGKDIISFMHGIYTYIPEANHVPKEYNVAAILSLLFKVPISLAASLVLMYFFISALSEECVHCPIWHFL